MLTNWVNLSIIFDLFWHYSEWIRLPCLCDIIYIYTNDRGLPQNYVTTTYSRWGNKKLCFLGGWRNESKKRWKTFSSPPQAFICPCFWYLNELMSKDIFSLLRFIVPSFISTIWKFISSSLSRSEVQVKLEKCLNGWVFFGSDQNISLRGRSQITSRFRGEGGWWFCDSSNKKFFSSYKFCDKGGGRWFQKSHFFVWRNLRTTPNSHHTGLDTV